MALEIPSTQSEQVPLPSLEGMVPDLVPADKVAVTPATATSDEDIYAPQDGSIPFDLDRRFVVGEMKSDHDSRTICFKTEDVDLIKRARRFTAQTYLARNFITQEEIGADGTIKPGSDPYVGHSDYYTLLRTAHGEDIVATVRKIRYDSEKGKASFPLLDHEDELYPDYVTKLREIGYENLVEVSALAKDRNLDPNGTAALQLYRKMFLDVWSNGREEESAFIMACSPKLFETFKLFFDGSMKRIGPDLQYPGQDTVPAMFAMREGAVNLINHSRDKNNHFAKVHQIIIDYFLDGADASTLHPSIIDALDRNGYQYILSKMRNSEIGEVEAPKKQLTIEDLKRETIKAVIHEKLSKRKPEIIGGIGLIGYTAVRTAMVGESISPYSDVDWRLFLGIELATTPQYVWGIGEMARSALRPEQYTQRKKLGALAAAGSALVAPYAYVAVEGAGMPREGWMGFGGLLALAGVSSAAGAIRKRVQKRKNLAAVPEA
jgi:hypothetical protein